MPRGHAVTPGLRVGLVEARDYASGTSSRSSKLFHGGLRYLEQFNFGLVFEALKERKLILNKLAPHLASIDTVDRGVAAAQEVADLVASTLGWDAVTVKREVEHYRSRVKAELESQEQPDDHTADAARLGAPDVRLGVSARPLDHDHPRETSHS